MKPVYVVGTGDTKAAELRYVRDRVVELGVPAVLVDVGTGESASRSAVSTGGDGAGDGNGADVGPDEVAAHHPDGPAAVRSTDRGEAVTAMSLALERFVLARVGELGGIIGIGGSGGTALVTPAMRALPVGVPKVMVSTVASGDVAPYVGPSDISMVYSVTDVAGLNRISTVVLGNAAHAVAGMVAHPVAPPDDAKPAVGLTMFGVTTPLVTQLTERLHDAWDPLVFHATGTGGRSMEKLVDSGLVSALLDTTTTEVADLVAGGVFAADRDRLGAVARTSVPYVGSVGACDMVNFGARGTVPERYADRLLHVHNANVTLMRTTAEENVAIGEFLATQLNRCEGQVRVLLPTGGVSMLDAPGQPFHDPDADEALFSTLERLLEPTERRRVQRVDAHVNDAAFAEALLEAFDEATAYTARDDPAGQPTTRSPNRATPAPRRDPQPLPGQDRPR